MLFEAPRIEEVEILVIDEIEKLHSQLSYTLAQQRRWTGMLRRDTSARNIRASNSIEGYSVTMEAAVAAVEGGEPPIGPKDENWLVTKGYRDAMTYVLQKAEDTSFRYEAELLKALHFMMVGYDLSKNPGRWRPGAIFVHKEPSGEQVYEGPPWELLEGLLAELMTELNAGESQRLVKAAMAHLNLVMIHPFSDGNGRMARCLQSLVLARSGVLASPFSGVEEYLGRNTQEYYEVLAQVGDGAWHPERDARPWLRFCLRAHYQQAHMLLRRSREIHRLFDEVEKMVAVAGLPDRTIAAAAEAAMGSRVTNLSYRVAADVSDAVAGNDLRAIVKAGLLVPEGEKRGRSYIAAAPLIAVRAKVRESRNVPDPFANPSIIKPAPTLPGVDIRVAKPSSTWPGRQS